MGIPDDADHKMHEDYIEWSHWVGAAKKCKKEIALVQGIVQQGLKTEYFPYVVMLATERLIEIELLCSVFFQESDPDKKIILKIPAESPLSVWQINLACPVKSNKI